MSFNINRFFPTPSLPETKGPSTPAPPTPTPGNSGTPGRLSARNSSLPTPLKTDNRRNAQLPPPAQGSDTKKSFSLSFSNPFASVTIKQAQLDPTLSTVARAELKQAGHMADVLAMLPKTDKGTWAAIKQHDPAGYKLLSRIVENALKSEVYNEAKGDPHQRRMLDSHVTQTFKRIEADFAAGKTDFCDHVMQTVKNNVGVNDAVVLGNLSVQFDAKALGFEAGHDLRVADDSSGACLRISSKWAALQAVGGEFKFEGANLNKLRGKQREYERDEQSGEFKAILRTHASGAKTLHGAASQANTEKWASEFTGADKTKYVDQVDVSAPQRMKDRGEVAQQGLREGESMLLTFYFKNADGKSMGHAMGLSRSQDGKEMKLLDPGTHQEFVFKGNPADFGPAVQAYIDEAWLKPFKGTITHQDVTRMSPKNGRDDSSVQAGNAAPAFRADSASQSTSATPADSLSDELAKMRAQGEKLMQSASSAFRPMTPRPSGDASTLPAGAARAA